jgi:streptogramin lyase
VKRTLVAAALALPLSMGIAQPSTAAVSEFPLPTAGSLPTGITSGPDGNLWVAGQGERIERVTPAGAVTEFTLPPPYGAVDIAAGGGFIWLTQPGVTAIGRLDPSAANIPASRIEFAAGGSKPNGIAPGPDGNVWFALAGSDQIGRITPAGSVTTFTVPGPGSNPAFITAGPDNALWFTEAGSSEIGRITTAGTVTNEFAARTLESRPSALGRITAGPDGALWFVDSGIDFVGRITTAGEVSHFPAPANSGLGGITAGPDGALWLTEARAGKIARMTTTGALSEYTLPTAASGPADITTGPDGALWFTERLAGRVGRITTDTAPDAAPSGPAGPQGPSGPTGPAGPSGPSGPRGATKLVVVAFQVRPVRPRAGRRVKVRFAITASARVALKVRRGRGRARTVARKRMRRAGIGTIAWNGKLGHKRARRGPYLLLVQATRNGRTVTSRIRVRLR